MPPRTLHTLAIPTLVALVPLLALSLVARFVPDLDALPIVLGYAAASIAILVVVHATPAATVVDARWMRWSVGAGLAIAFTGFALGKFAHGHVALDVAGALLNSAGMLFGAVALGAFVGRGVLDLGHLPAVALMSSAGDIWSVSSVHGVTHAIIATPDLVMQRLFTVSAAVPPSPVPNGMIGAGDVVFAALYVAVARKFGLSHTRTLVALGVGLLLALVATFALRMPVPALPFLGACVIAAHPRTWRIPRKDRLATSVAGALLLVMFVRAVIAVRAG